MLRDITLGQYYQTESLIHRLDPRVKLGGTLLFILSLFFFRNPLGYAVAVLFLAMVIKLSKVPFKFMVKGMKSILFLMLFTVVFNLFLTPGEALVTVWKVSITWEGIVLAATMALRLSLLVIGSSVMTLTTTPNNLTDGMEKGLRFLKVFRMPVHEVAMMMSIALRFIPILLEETDKIMKAQLARGADFESGNLIKRAKAMVPLLVPLFISAFRRANDLAMAMEARCYRGGEGRTKMKPLVYKKRDFAAYACILAYMVLSIALGRIGAQNVNSTDLGSFSLYTAYSFDGKFHARMEEDEELIRIVILDMDENQVDSFEPVLKRDFRGICWEKASYNIWIQSGDTGLVCYRCENGKWQLDPEAERPDEISAKKYF